MKVKIYKTKKCRAILSTIFNAPKFGTQLWLKSKCCNLFCISRFNKIHTVLTPFFAEQVWPETYNFERRSRHRSGRTWGRVLQLHLQINWKNIQSFTTNKLKKQSKFKNIRSFTTNKKELQLHLQINLKNILSFTTNKKVLLLHLQINLKKTF